MSRSANVKPAVVPSSAPPEEALTPAMRQYREQKQQAGDAILLFRMGDFYEMFYADAELGARVLGIALTSRDDAGTPMAGIPYHALENYLTKLVAAGHKVAISEQLEDATQAKGVIKRAIVRVVTPGTLTDESMLDRTRSNILAAVWQQNGQSGVATLELSTGQFLVRICDDRGLLDELCRIAPAEVLLPEGGQVGRHPLESELRERLSIPVTYRSASEFSPPRAERLFQEQFETRNLAGFGFEQMDISLQAAGALLAYVRETQKAAAKHIRPPRRHALEEYMVLDPTTLRSLEIERTLRTGSREGSLLAAVDRTANPMGARLLRHWLCYPLRDAESIQRRQRLIELLRTDDAARNTLRAALREMSDIERMVGRIGVQRTHPRELRALGDSLQKIVGLREMLRGLKSPECDDLASALENLDELAIRLCSALKPDAPLTLREGKIFAEGHHAELDRLRIIGSDGQRWLADFQAREARRTGISSLKVAFNRIHGYYIEITNTHRDRVPPEYIRRQTVKNAERYITDELKRYEDEALAAESKANELEYELFLQLRDMTAGHIPQLQRTAAALAALDVLAGWAELSLRQEYCRPAFVEEPVLEIEEGRHPVVEQALAGGFVSNQTHLKAGGASLALITGPNMAGKSTYIRQVALLTLLAHCGCFVPAKRMRLGLVDRIFTRVGASDELARGQSTFMVEMVETANILHNATAQSLVILDEVGRGTSTFDGLSLAWAITEHLAARTGCRALFATHYHELTELAQLLESVLNLNVAVREYEDQVVFLHRIVPGAANRSYGLHVARLAGISPQVLERANAVLNELEKTFARESQRPALAAVQRRRQRQLRLFEEPEETVVRELRELTQEKFAPATALELVRKWRRLLGLSDEAAK